MTDEDQALEDFDSAMDFVHRMTTKFGWTTIATPVVNDSAPVCGMIVGTPEFIEEFIQRSGRQLSVWDTPKVN